MTDYKKLVKALRCCAGFIENPSCAKCAYVDSTKCKLEMMTDAADAIEELQQIADHHEQTAKDYWKEACEYKAQLPKRGEWELIDGAEPMRWGCSLCKYLSWETSNYCPRCGANMEAQE